VGFFSQQMLEATHLLPQETWRQIYKATQVHTPSAVYSRGHLLAKLYDASLTLSSLLISYVAHSPSLKLYRPSDRSLLAKLLPTLADRGCRVVSATDPHGRNLGFLDPLLLRKSGSAGNRTRICSQELWPLDHRGGLSPSLPILIAGGFRLTVQSAATCSRWLLALGFLYPEDGGDKLLRNVGSHKNYTAPHPRKRHSSLFYVFILFMNFVM
jgi:hypothetical protein